jgi:hypothetical protein
MNSACRLRGRPPVDLPGPRVEGREQVQRPTTAVLVLDTSRPVHLRRQRLGLPRPRLQAGHLVDAEDQLVGPQRPGVQVADRLDLGGERRVARHLGRQPRLLPPRLEAVVQQDLTHRRRRDRLHHTAADQLAGDLGAVPLRQRPPGVIRPLTSDLHHVHRDLGGKRPACGRDRDDPAIRRDDPSGTAGPTCAHASLSSQPAGRPRPVGARQRPRGSPGIAGRSRGRWSYSGGVAPGIGVPPPSRSRATSSCGLSSVPPRLGGPWQGRPVS